MSGSLPPVPPENAISPPGELKLAAAKQLFLAAVNEPTPVHPSTKWHALSCAEMAPLFPKYELQSMIGRGGMGAVYLARDPELNRHVAIKILPPELAHQAGFQERFRREAQSLAKLDHPNIILIHELGTTAGHLYFVMDYVVGKNLADLMKEHLATKAQGGLPVLTFSFVLEIARQVSAALQAAHEQEIIHRDIKPANILVTPKGRVKVADFGLARTITGENDSQITKAHEVMGTADYMAPEVLRGDPSDAQSDQYSLGVVLYEMIMGVLPRGNFPLPSERGLHPRVDAIVLKALNADRTQRFPDMASFARALATLRPSDGHRTRWRQRVLIAGCLGLIGVGAGASWAMRPRPPLADPAASPAIQPNSPLAEGLLYEESFDYPMGPSGLTGQGGFKPKYGSLRPATEILSGSPSYQDAAGNRLLTRGNSAHVDSTREASQIDDLTELTLPTDLPGTLWISLLGKQTSGTTARFFNLSLRARDNTSLPHDAGNSDDEILSVGMPSGASVQQWHIWDRTTDQPERRVQHSAVATNQLSFLLVRMELNVNEKGCERYTLWVNPRLDRSPAPAEGVSFTSMASDVEQWHDLKVLRLGAGAGDRHGPSSGFMIDEIRLGTSATSVMPMAAVVP